MEKPQQPLHLLKSATSCSRTDIKKPEAFADNDETTIYEILKLDDQLCRSIKLTSATEKVDVIRCLDHK